MLTMSPLKLQSGVCVSTLKEEAAATRSKSRGKGSIKDSAVTRDKDKKGRESQRSKRQTSAKTKAKGSDQSRLPHVSSTSDCTEEAQHQGILELKRSQRQGPTHTDTL